MNRNEQGLRSWQRGMRVATAANVCEDLRARNGGSGLTVESIRPFVLQTIEAFGVSRSMFASNFPVDKLYSDFDTLYTAFREITAGFSAEERRMLFHDNAARYYRLLDVSERPLNANPSYATLPL